jgi:hypothetical protein
MVGTTPAGRAAFPGAPSARSHPPTTRLVSGCQRFVDLERKPTAGRCGAEVGGPGSLLSGRGRAGIRSSDKAWLDHRNGSDQGEDRPQDRVYGGGFSFGGGLVTGRFDGVTVLGAGRGSGSDGTPTSKDGQVDEKDSRGPGPFCFAQSRGRGTLRELMCRSRPVSCSSPTIAERAASTVSCPTRATSSRSRSTRAARPASSTSRPAAVSRT